MTEQTAQHTIVCAKHPKVETYVRCASCGTPVCEKCRVLTSVGYKCRDCGTIRQASFTRLAPGRMALVILIGLAGGALAGIGAAVTGMMFFIGLFIAAIYGRFVGTLILRASSGKMGLALELVTGISLAVGALAVIGLKALPVVLALMSTEFTWTLLLSGLSFGIVDLILIAVVIAAAISRLRFTVGSWF